MCAGGTGGHMFPAEALAHALLARGWGVELATDARGRRYAETFPAARTHILRAGTPFSRNPLATARAVLALGRGYLAGRSLVRGHAAVVGFGGYPTVPPLMAAAHRGVPCAIHEQNAVLGRANRLLAPRVGRVASGFPVDSATTVGNPVRPAVLDAAASPYAPAGAGEPFHLLVFGGSQGAQFFAEFVPGALAALPASDRHRLRVTLQARDADAPAARAALAEAGIEAEVEPFFADMARRIAGAHLVVSRAGASTVSELAVIGRPALLVPYPHALDHDQAANAAEMVATGGAEVVVQAEMPDRFGSALRAALDNPQALAQKAAAAKRAGRPDAAEQLADLVEELAEPAGRRA